jgi:helix-turn-helix protein
MENEKQERQYLINVDSKTLQFWKLNKKQGTIMHIKNLHNISRVTLTNAFIKGQATQNTIDVINEYFRQEIEKEQRRLRRKNPIF